MTQKSKQNTAKPPATAQKPANKGGRPKKLTDIEKIFESFEFDFDFEKPNKSREEKLFVKKCCLGLMVAGTPPIKAAQIVKVHPLTASRWFNEMTPSEKREAETALLANISKNVGNFLNSSLVALANVAEVCSSHEYLMKHEPGAVAELFEVIGNQSFKLVEARQRYQLAEKEAELTRASQERETRALNARQSQQQTDQSASDQKPKEEGEIYERSNEKTQ